MPDALRILLRGSPRWVGVLEDLLPEVGVATRQATKPMQMPHALDLRSRWHWWRTQVVHQVMLDVRSLNTAKVFRQATSRNIPVIVHWIGSDVIRLRKHLDEHGEPPANLFDHIAIHLADSPALADELRELGVDTRLVRLLPRSVNADVSDLPTEPAVLVYLPHGAEAFYRIDIVKALAGDFPEVPFHIAANDGRNAGECPANMQFLGEVREMDALYRRVNVLLRICEHDSLSAMVLEALARGRYVIYSEPFPHTAHARDAETAREQLRDILSRTDPHHQGAQMIAELFSWRSEMERMREIYREAIAAR